MTNGIPKIDTQKIKEIKNMYNMIMSSGNPEAMMNQMMNSNPQLKQMYEGINSIYNGDAQSAFYTEAHKMGMNDEQIKRYLEQLKSQLQ